MAFRDSVEESIHGLLPLGTLEYYLQQALVYELLAESNDSVLAMDLDRFKFINDHYGHSMGDRALSWVAATMRGMLRENDHLGRHGGDEFIAVLPNTTHAAALEIASRIAEVVCEGAAREAAYPGVTIGVATTPEDGDRAASLLEAADAWLYAQKKHCCATGDAVDGAR